MVIYPTGTVLQNIAEMTIDIIITRQEAYLEATGQPSIRLEHKNVNQMLTKDGTQILMQYHICSDFILSLLHYPR